jgi:glycosyltransferase involved in cell wall biosynthesis
MQMDAIADPVLIETDGIYNFVLYKGQVFSIPLSLGPVNLRYDSIVGRPGVFVAPRLHQVKRLVEAHKIANVSPLQFVPMLSTPANVAFWGNNHPAYASIFSPDYKGIRIVGSPSSASCDNLVLERLDVALTRFRARMRAEAAEIDDETLNEFIRTRDYFSQLIAAAHGGLHFLQGAPLTLGDHPWLMQIETAASLFLPFVTSADSWSFDRDTSQIYQIIRTLMLSDECLGVVTNIRATKEALPTLFRSPALAEKVFHLPFATKLCAQIAQRNGKRFLFTTSWHQHERSFYRRGGIDALLIFLELAKRHKGLELTIRAKIPSDIGLDMREKIASANIRVIDEWIEPDAIASLFDEADFYLLPAMDLHSMSTIEAMSHGCICVLADSWGSDEYLFDQRNGLRIPGREGKYWRYGQDEGFVYEREFGIEKPDEAFIYRAVQAIDPLLLDSTRRNDISDCARRHVAEHHSVERARMTFEGIIGDVRTRMRSVMDRYQAHAVACIPPQ